MAVHAKTIEWHDLIEDPNDLPDRDCHCYVTIANTYDAPLMFCMERVATYKVGLKQWAVVNDEYYGEQFELYQVVAWAYKPSMFVPEGICNK